MRDENPYAVSTELQDWRAEANHLPPSDNLAFVGRRVRCRSGDVLPAICVVTGSVDDLVMVSRRLTTQWQIQIWGPTMFAALAASNSLSNPGPVLPSPLMLVTGVCCLLWALIQRFIVPFFCRACVVRYFIRRDQMRNRRVVGIAAIVGSVVLWNIIPFLRVMSGNSESIIVLGVLFATSLSISDRAFRGPIRLVLHGRRSRHLLEGFGEPFKKAIEEARLPSAIQ